MRELVNLLVDLQSDHFDGLRFDGIAREAQALGFRLHRGDGDDAFFAWIDQEFGGTWSSEAFAGRNVIAMRGGQFAGFATADPRALNFAWLRGKGSEPGVGVFGPFGVAPQFRKTGLGPLLLRAALLLLREKGYTHALVPAVGGEALIRYYAQHTGAQIAERFDKSRWMARKRRAVVLASGSGSNFQSVIDGIAQGRLPLELGMLVSNKSGAYALERARSSGIHAVALPWQRSAQSRESYDHDLFEVVHREQPELVLLLGWMHVLDDRFIAAFPEIINIHPAFLPLDQSKDEVTFPDGTVTPAFRGAKAVADALVWGSRWVGASAHRVTLEADRGPVLARAPLALQANDTQETIMRRLHPLEHQVLSAAITRWVYER